MSLVDRFDNYGGFKEGGFSLNWGKLWRGNDICEYAMFVYLLPYPHPQNHQNLLINSIHKFEGSV